MKSKIVSGITIIVGLIIFVGGPLFVQYTHWPHGSSGNGDWLSFWGSYLGVIPSGMIAYIVAKVQIRDSKESERLQRNETHYLDELRALYMSLVKLGEYEQRLSLFRETELSFKKYVTAISFIKGYDDVIAKINLNNGTYDSIKHAIILIPKDGNENIAEAGTKLSEEINKIDFYTSLYRQKKFYEDGTSEMPKYLSDLKVVDNLLESIKNMSNYYNDLEAELVSEIKKYTNINSQ
ncbi:hypothetical protein [Leuconostoc mesenteroides]|uniref:hypothetical protein n=1 Tax=Leuconostoc mesenteroides TaxID=1245 RepID=UPI00235E451C|nr:hypothetical protein [Leuconostoc mesenteroides]